MFGWMVWCGLLTLASCSRLVAEIIMHHSSSILVKSPFRILVWDQAFVYVILLTLALFTFAFLPRSGIHLNLLRLAFLAMHNLIYKLTKILSRSYLSSVTWEISLADKIWNTNWATIYLCFRIVKFHQLHLCTYYHIFEVHFFVFKEVFWEISLLMYG